MLTKRIIPCLDVKYGRVVKGTNFVNLKDAGSAVELAEKYYNEGADELVFLDITATEEKRKTVLELVKSIAVILRIPFTVGGGISNLNDIESILKAGADKVSLNSAIVNNPDLIVDAAKLFGSQAIVAAVDVKKIESQFFVYINGGKTKTDINGLEWIIEVFNRGAGELLLTSMDKDGTGNGFEIEFLNSVTSLIDIPVIASGGAGCYEHFYDAFQYANVDACLAAGLFHFGKMTIPDLKQFLMQKNIPVRL